MYVQAREGLGQVLGGCPKRERFKVAKAAVWSLPAAVFFKAGMAIDADGAPNAYHPMDKGLDYLKNAGFPPKPGKRPWGIVTIDGKPVIQRMGDPFPGYFVSGTSLVDGTRPRTDPRRYVDSTRIPYIALSKALADKLGVKLGDFAAVINGKNRRLSYAIFADIGPPPAMGVVVLVSELVSALAPASISFIIAMRSSTFCRSAASPSSTVDSLPPLMTASSR